LPAAITGASSLCQGSTAVYTGTVGGSGTWSSSDAGVATVHATSGMTTGISNGTATLTYLIAASGCYTTRTITVNPAPEAIAGPSALCVGSTTTLTSATSGGTWTCSSNGVGTIESSTGAITGATAGGTTVTYTLTNGCRKTKSLSVAPIPAAIAGPSTVCAGGTSMFSCSTSGGTWSSTNESVALPESTSGFAGSSNTSMVSGVTTGSAVISYTLASGCARAIGVTVVAAKPGAPVPTAIEANVEFSVYPNPTSGAFTIKSSATGVFAIYSIDGKMVQQYNITEPATTVSLPNDLASGVYMCQFMMQDGTTKSTRLVYQQ
jgi:hypothetical protein